MCFISNFVLVLNRKTNRNRKRDFIFIFKDGKLVIKIPILAVLVCNVYYAHIGALPWLPQIIMIVPETWFKRQFLSKFKFNVSFLFVFCLCKVGFEKKCSEQQ